MKVVETTGKTTRSAVSTSDPFPRESCMRDGCPLSRSDKGCRSRCYKSNINYTYTCTRCEQEQISTDGEEQQVAQYRGESSRTSYSRNRDHQKLFRQRNDSFMWDHIAEKHGEETSGEDFRMELCKVDRDPMRRVLREAIRIKRAGDGEVMEIPDADGKMTKVKITLLNDKREWFCPTIVTVRAQEI